MKTPKQRPMSESHLHKPEDDEDYYYDDDADDDEANH